MFNDPRSVEVLLRIWDGDYENVANGLSIVDSTAQHFYSLTAVHAPESCLGVALCIPALRYGLIIMWCGPRCWPSLHVEAAAAEFGICCPAA